MSTNAKSAVVTCPRCETKFNIAVVDSSPKTAIPCPDCSSEIHVFFTDEDHVDGTGRDRRPSLLEASLVEWEEQEPRDPYSAHEATPELGKRIRAEVQVNGESIPVTIQHVESGYATSYTVRAKTDAGQRSKDAYRFSSTDPRLYFADKGVPWDEDKRWTYLDREECERRAAIAGLGDVFKLEDGHVGSEHGVLLDETARPLIDEDGAIPTDLVLKLTKGLLAFQSKANPAP